MAGEITTDNERRFAEFEKKMTERQELMGSLLQQVLDQQKSQQATWRKS